MINAKKCGIPFIIGYGILTKNPEVVTERDLRYYRPLLYVKYDGWWYVVKGDFPSIEELYNYLTKEIYCKEQFLEKLMYII